MKDRQIQKNRRLLAVLSPSDFGGSEGEAAVVGENDVAIAI